MTTRPIYGFHQRFRKPDGTPNGGWKLSLFATPKNARIMRKLAHGYSEVGPIFTTKEVIPKRNRLGGSYVS